MTAQRFRVYGSKDSWYASAERRAPAKSPIVFEECPAPGYRTSFYYGELPAAIVEADHARTAFLNYCGNWFWRGEHAGLTPDAGIEAELARLDKSTQLSAAEYRWYTTVEIQREIRVALDQITLQTAEDLEREMLDRTSEFLDRAVAQLAISQGRGFYRKRLVDYVLFYGLWAYPRAAPRFGLTATGGCVLPDTSFPTPVVQSLDRLAGPAYEAISLPCHWYLEALNETDAFKGFMFASFAMEILVNQMESSLGLMKTLAAPAVKEQVRLVMVENGVEKPEFDRPTPYLRCVLLVLRLDLRFRSELAHGGSADVEKLREYVGKALTWLEPVLGAAMKVLSPAPPVSDPGSDS
jgi:hypothetical protein